MTKRENKFAKIKNNPKNVSIEELTTLLEWAGFELRRIDGSHHVFKKPGVREKLSVPFDRPVKTVYVKLAIRLIEEYGDLDE